MLDQQQRTTILELRRQGMGTRSIARTLTLSRGTVREVLRSGSAEVPRLARPEKAEPHRQTILELLARCKGNLARVHEELVAGGLAMSYPALTAFCRRQGIGRDVPRPAGRYHFDPGQEMQHDTSVHPIRLEDGLRKVPTASLVLCYSRMLFFQFFPRFTRFECKVFLDQALRSFGGACRGCMIDNTHIVVLNGTGREMEPVPEMAAFAARYGFVFRAHERGDANRSARVERPFGFIEGNFLAGRVFRDLADANAQARTWCDRVNGSFKRHLHATPKELFAVEQVSLRPLAAWLPPIYLLHQRMVDVEGLVTVNTNRYSVPPTLIGRRVEVRETWERIEVYDGPRLIASHVRHPEPTGERFMLDEHRVRRSRVERAASVEEQELSRRAPELQGYVAALKAHAAGRGTLLLRRLLQLVSEYPRESVVSAIEIAAHYGMYDLNRLERMVLRRIEREYFLTPGDD
jgi:transposase